MKIGFYSLRSQSWVEGVALHHTTGPLPSNPGCPVRAPTYPIPKCGCLEGIFFLSHLSCVKKDKWHLCFWDPPPSLKDMDWRDSSVIQALFLWQKTWV